MAVAQKIGVLSVAVLEIRGLPFGVYARASDCLEQWRGISEASRQTQKTTWGIPGILGRS